MEIIKSEPCGLDYKTAIHGQLLGLNPLDCYPGGSRICEKNVGAAGRGRGGTTLTRPDFPSP